MSADNDRQNWRPSFERTQSPLYQAIADAIAQAIERHELRPGEQLPPQRRLATNLGVDLTTVTRAYAEAQRRGLLEAGVGRGTFVRRDEPAPPDATARSVLDMSMNLPPQPQEPSLRDAVRDGLERLLRRTDTTSLMSYRAGAASRLDRAAAANWLEPVMGTIDPNRILVCAGAQCALTALLTMVAKSGDTVLTEPLTYPGLRALAAHLGIRLIGVATDEAGLLPQALEQACRETQPKAIYCVPTNHNPTTVTTPLERRHALAAVAQKLGVSVIEDDAYGTLPATPLPAVASVAPGPIYYVSTLSKCLSPGLRTAYVVAPGRAEAARLAEAVRATSLTASPLMASLATQWVNDGTAAALRDAIRHEAIARQRIAQAILPEAYVAAQSDGLHVWLTLPEHWNRLDFCAHVRRQGLALVPGDAFAVGTSPPNAVRIALGAANSQAALRVALQAVADALQADPPSYLLGVV